MYSSDSFDALSKLLMLRFFLLKMKIFESIPILHKCYNVLDFFQFFNENIRINYFQNNYKVGYNDLGNVQIINVWCLIGPDWLSFILFL